MRCLRYLLFVFITINVSYAQENHWETVIKAEEQWRYFAGTLNPVPVEPSETWRTLSFDDTTWPEGPGGFGYADDDDGTIIPASMSVLLRKKFTIVDKVILSRAVLSVDYDDGFVAYLNGVEIARANMDGRGAFPLSTQPSAGFGDENLVHPLPFVVSNETLQELLVNGENVLAVQVHNENSGSSDLTSNVYFSVGITNTSFTYQPLPDWFVVPPEPLNFTSSDLPIVVINTSGQWIADDPKITAHMGVIDNGVGNRNYLTDAYNNYNGVIGIETRGESSQTFPKKSYALETRDEAGENINVELLGFPAENDWILYAPYTDKSMVRNDITYKLARDMGRYASRTRACEVVLNGDYQGVYMLMEKIKRDDSRVDIATLNPDEISGDDLTGGYILRIDKWDNNDYPSWRIGNIDFQYFDPQGDELAFQQRSYIQNFIAQANNSISSVNFTHSKDGYRKYFDVNACIDFMLMNELAKNVDGYNISTYMYKDKDSNGGKLVMGPVWDFNLAYGNAYYNTKVIVPEGEWLFNDNRVYWFEKFTRDVYFRNKMYTRWDSLREDELSNERISYLIDSMAVSMDEAQARNYQRWPILGQNIWPNVFIGETYAAEIAWLKDWIIRRANWMDANMPGTRVPPEEPEEPVVTGTGENVNRKIYVYPNPGRDVFKIQTDVPLTPTAQLTITDMMGRQVFSSTLSEKEFSWDGRNNAGGAIQAGVYIITVKDSNRRTFITKIIKE